MSEFEIIIDERKVKELVFEYVREKVGFDFNESDVNIETKSKENYKSEWEKAAFRARLKLFI